MKYIITLTLLLFTSSVAFAIDPVNHPDITDEGFINLDDAAPAPAGAVVEGQDLAPIAEQIPSAEEIKTDEQVAPLAVQDQVAPVEAEVDEYAKIFDGNNYDSLNLDFKSLFYSPEQTDLIYSNLSNFKSSGGAVGELTKTDEAADGSTTGDNSEQIQQVTKQIFYLSSILYPDDEKWTLWMNGNKMRKEDSDNDLIVESIDKDSAVFIYKLSEPAKYISNLDAKTRGGTSEGDWNFVSEDGNLKMNTGTGKIRFKLKINQAFILNDLKIVEGNGSDVKITPPPAPAGIVSQATTAVTNAAADAKEIVQKAIDDVSNDDSKNLDMLKPESSEKPANKAAAVPVEGAITPPVATPSGQY